jgi:hypothetical protein
LEAERRLILESIALLGPIAVQPDLGSMPVYGLAIDEDLPKNLEQLWAQATPTDEVLFRDVEAKGVACIKDRGDARRVRVQLERGTRADAYPDDDLVRQHGHLLPVHNHRTHGVRDGT